MQTYFGDLSSIDTCDVISGVGIADWQSISLRMSRNVLLLSATHRSSIAAEPDVVPVAVLVVRRRFDDVRAKYRARSVRLHVRDMTRYATNNDDLLSARWSNVADSSYTPAPTKTRKFTDNDDDVIVAPLDKLQLRDGGRAACALPATDRPIDLPLLYGTQWLAGEELMRSDQVRDPLTRHFGIFRWCSDWVNLVLFLDWTRSLLACHRIVVMAFLKWPKNNLLLAPHQFVSVCQMTGSGYERRKLTERNFF